MQPYGVIGGDEAPALGGLRRKADLVPGVGPEFGPGDFGLIGLGEAFHFAISALTRSSVSAGRDGVAAAAAAGASFFFHLAMAAVAAVAVSASSRRLGVAGGDAARATRAA